MSLKAMLVAVAAGAFLCGGCAGPGAPAPAPRASNADAELDRAGAIASARWDAWKRQHDVRAYESHAWRIGRYWIVELRSPGGGSIQYAISARDGAIKERNTIQ